jgi:methyl-accepting chemotaxis protein
VSNEMDKLNEIAVKVSAMEATQKAQAESVGKMANSVDRLVDKWDKSDDVAKEAAISARSAHKRIDRIDRIINWVGTTIIGTLVIAVVTFIVKGGLVQ